MNLSTYFFQKTKRTITENEQLKKEVTYHTRQTDILMQKNEKLILETADLHRDLAIAKEVSLLTSVFCNQLQELCNF
jgi:hypothetical protein